MICKIQILLIDYSLIIRVRRVMGVALRLDREEGK